MQNRRSYVGLAKMPPGCRRLVSVRWTSSRHVTDGVTDVCLNLNCKSRGSGATTPSDAHLLRSRKRPDDRNMGPVSPRQDIMHIFEPCSCLPLTESDCVDGLCPRGPPPRAGSETPTQLPPRLASPRFFDFHRKDIGRAEHVGAEYDPLLVRGE